MRSDELHAAEEIAKRLANERLLLEQRSLRLEKKKAEEVVSTHLLEWRNFCSLYAST